jgi:hypothetical protein
MRPTGKYRYSPSAYQQTGSFHRLILILLLSGSLLPLSALAWQWYQPAKSPSAAAAPFSSASAHPRPADYAIPPDALPNRPLYPYSVIPGGATDAQELEHALATDPVVAAHYADFNTANLRVVRLDHARSMYVSYRLGNRIYWTSHKLALAKGEMVLTDGEREARTRCGNRLSDVPRAPVALVEPDTAVLDNPAPEVALLPESVGDLPFPLAYPPIAGVPPTGGGIFIPPIIPIGPGGGGGGGGGSNNPPTPPGPPVPPPVATPEPGTLLLLSTGFLAAWLTRPRSAR